MPLYEFICTTCGRKQEFLMKVCDPNPTCSHPHLPPQLCLPKVMQRVLSSPARVNIEGFNAQNGYSK